MLYAIIDVESVYASFLAQVKRYDNILDADVEETGNILQVFDGEDIVFACNISERWQSWCERQKFADANWNYKSIEHPHFCEVMERWVRFCVHCGASEGRTGLPNRMLQPAANKDTPAPATQPEASGSRIARPGRIARSYF